MLDLDENSGKNVSFSNNLDNFEEDLQSAKELSLCSAVDEIDSLVKEE